MGIYQKGQNWYIDFYIRRQRVRRKIGPSRKLAVLALKDAEVKIAKGEYLGIYEEHKMLFSVYAGKYLKYSGTNKGERTYRSDCSTFRNHLLPFFGKYYLSTISTKTVEDYKQERAKQARSPATVNREMATLKHALSTAVKYKYIKENPAVGVKLLKVTPKEPRYLSKEECRALLAQCPPHLYPIVLAALNTGMRRGELFNLMWEDVDFWKGTITVRNRKDFHTKNYENRMIPMNDLLWRTLRELPEDSTSLYVFGNKSGRPYDDLKRSYHTAVKKAGLGHVRFHDLRHTFASHLVMAGVDLRTVQALMGHKTIQMTIRYSHLAPEHLKGAVEKLDFGTTENSDFSHYLDTKPKKAEKRHSATLG